MATATNIVLADAQGTPVNHTFAPFGTADGVFSWVDSSATNEIGFWRISAKLKRPQAARPGQSSANRVTRVTLTLSEPVLETVSNNSAGYIPAPTVAYIPRASVEFILPERGALLDRKNIRKMMALLLADANVVSIVENLQTPQ